MNTSLRERLMPVFTEHDDWFAPYANETGRAQANEQGLASDIGHAIAAGANETAALPFWGLEALTGSETLGNIKRYFKESAEKKREGYSDAMKQSMAKEFITEGEDGFGLGEAWTDPRSIVGSVAESIPGMAAGFGVAGAVAKGLGALGMSSKLAWGIGSAVGEGSVAAGQNSLDVHGAVMDMDEEKLAQSPEYQTLLATGLSQDEARKELAASVSANVAWKTGLSTGVLGAPMGAAFGKAVGGEIGKRFSGTLAKQTLGEGIEETFQSGAETYLSQGEQQRADPSIDPWHGVANSSVQGFLAGGVMGAGMSPLAHIGGRRAQERKNKAKETGQQSKAKETEQPSEFSGGSPNDNAGTPPPAPPAAPVAPDQAVASAQPEPPSGGAPVAAAQPEQGPAAGPEPSVPQAQPDAQIAGAAMPAAPVVEQSEAPQLTPLEAGLSAMLGGVPQSAPQAVQQAPVVPEPGLAPAAAQPAVEQPVIETQQLAAAAMPAAAVGPQPAAVEQQPQLAGAVVPEMDAVAPSAVQTPEPGLASTPDPIAQQEAVSEPTAAMPVSMPGQPGEIPAQPMTAAPVVQPDTATGQTSIFQKVGKDIYAIDGVEVPPDMEDTMRDLGAKYNPKKAWWAFPAKRLDAVREALGVADDVEQATPVAQPQQANDEGWEHVRSYIGTREFGQGAAQRDAQKNPEYEYRAEPHKSNPNKGGRISRKRKGLEATQNADAPKQAAQSEADTFGQAYPEYTGKPDDAIEHLLDVRQGYVPGAFDKEGVGPIDLVWGKAGKKGFGLAHIIERRNEQGLDGIAFARNLPKLIAEGQVERREGFTDRLYVVAREGNAESVIRLNWDGKRRTWLATAYIYHDKMSSSEVPAEPQTYSRTRGDEQRISPSPSEDVGDKVSGSVSEVKPAEKAADGQEQAPVETRADGKQTPATARREALPNKAGHGLNRDVDLDASVSVVAAEPKFAGQNPKILRKRFPEAVRAEVLGAFRAGLVNEDTGWEVGMSAKDFSEHLKFDDNDEIGGLSQLEAIAALPELMRTARLVESYDDKKGIREIKKMHMFQGALRLGDKDYSAQMTIKEYDKGRVEFDDTIKLYHHRLKKQMSAGNSYAGSSVNPRKPSADINKYSLRELLEGVKDSAGEPYIAPEQASTEAKPQGKSEAQIDDFGEKIGGARKDVWQATRKRLEDADAAGLSKEPAEKVFPTPDYESLVDGGMDKEAVACLHALRDLFIAAKAETRKKWRHSAALDRMEHYRDLAVKLLGAMEDTASLPAFMRGFTAQKLLQDERDAMDLYMAVGHSHSLAGVRISKGSYSVLDGKHYSPPKTLWTVEKPAKATAFSNWPRELARGETREDAIRDFVHRTEWLFEEQDKKEKEVSFVITVDRKTRSQFTVSKKIGSEYVDVAGPFASVDEARTYAREHHDELVEKLNRMKEIPNERRESNDPRVGEDHRNGQDVTPDMFAKAFGFRGVEFGNWVEQDKRQSDLNDAYDALMDLAGVLGVSPRALSLNGELGLAFGARGTGGKRAAKAHYERDSIAINLTKKRGSGTLAHEWMHALDNYFSRKSGKAGEFLTDAKAVHYAALPEAKIDYMKYADPAWRTELVKAWAGVRKAIHGTGLEKRSKTLDKTRSKAYWSTDIEMMARAFESYIIAKLQDQNAANDYLANIVSEDAWGVSANKEQGYPYPTQAEMTGIRAAFDNLFQTVEQRETDKGIALASLKQDEVVGRISEEIAKSLPLQKAGDIRLDADGIAHIEKEHGKDIRNVGFNDAASFIYYVVKNFESIYQGKGIRDVALVVNGGKNLKRAVLKLEFSKDGDFYRVKTAGPVGIGFYKNKKLLWERAPSSQLQMESPNAFSGQSSSSEKKNTTPNAEVKPASIAGSALPASPAGRGIRAVAVRRVVDALQKRAARSVPVEVVQSAEKLPANLRGFVASLRGDVEGLYDPATGTVYLTADNLASPERAAEVWMHEVLVHRGLRGLFSSTEMQRLLNRMWVSLGGMGNGQLAQIAKRYGFDPRGNLKDRATVVEEYLANMAERRAAGKLDTRNQSAWRRFVQAVLEVWRAVVRAVAGRSSSMRYDNVDALLGELEGYIFGGRPEQAAAAQADMREAALASVDELTPEAEHAAWEQVLADTEEWGRQVDEFAAGPKGETSLLTVCRTPDVLQKLGAPDLPMAMTRENLVKVMSDKPDHGLTKDVLKQLPKALAEPVMVFESATTPESFVVLTEIRHEGRSVMAAIHLDTERQRIRVNDIASAYKRKGEQWYIGQIEDGRLLYQDKKKSLAWARTARLQLPLVRKLPSRLSGKTILTDLDVVKPVEHPELAAAGSERETEKPLASLRDSVAERLTTRKEREHSGISKQELADNPALAEALGKIGVQKPSIAERFAAMKENWARKIEQGIFDRFAALKDVSKVGYELARMTTNIGSQLYSILAGGHPVWKDGAMAVEGKSLLKVFEPVNSELDRFLSWMVGRRAERLMSEGRENNFTAENIAAMKKLSLGKMADGRERSDVYAKVFSDFADFKKSMLDFAQGAGLIDPESRAVWENADYIPFYRVQEELDGAVAGPHGKKGLTGQNAGIQQLKGGTDNIGDPLENIMRNFAHLIDASQKNITGRTILADLRKAGLATELSPAEMRAQLEALGLDLKDGAKLLYGDKKAIGPLTAGEKKAVMQMLRPREGFISVMEDGVPTWFSVEDPLLYRAMTNVRQSDSANDPVSRMFRTLRRALTTGVTVMPDFIVRNFLRDTLSVWAQEHKSGFRPLWDSVKQIKGAFNMDADMMQLMAGGGSFMGSGYRMGYSSEEQAKAIRKMLKDNGIGEEAFEASLLNTPKKLAGFISKAFGYYERAGSASENASRLAVYKKLRARGMSHREAAYAAKDLMDFTMRGEWAAIRVLTDSVPFLGARLAGLHRLGRGAVENPKAFAFKGATIAAASMLLYAVNLLLHGDDWDKLEDWEKDSYYHFWVGGKRFCLPKPFEVGYLFGTIPERMMEQLMTDKPGRVMARRVLAGLCDQLAFNPVPQALRPIAEQTANKDFFRGSSIVGMGLSRKKAVEQYKSTTSETAKLVARAFDTLLKPLDKVAGEEATEWVRSPVRIEHMVRGYLGGLGMSVLGLSDVVMRNLTGEPDTPARRLEEMPVIRAFYRGGKDTPGRARYESALYDALRDADKLAASIKQKQEEGVSEKAIAAGTKPEDAILLANRKGMRKVAAELTKLNKMAEKVRKSPTLTPARKREMLDNIQVKRNILTKRVMQKVETELNAAA